MGRHPKRGTLRCVVESNPLFLDWWISAGLHAARPECSGWHADRLKGSPKKERWVVQVTLATGECIWYTSRELQRKQNSPHQTAVASNHGPHPAVLAAHPSDALTTQLYL